MADPTVLITDPDADNEGPPAASRAAQPAADILVLEDELLIEDVSIDGMCGVY